MIKFNTTHKGFTLAEILITLGIIGVIAAITIPVLINNYQKTQYVASLKKVYTNLCQVIQQMAMDNGTPDSVADYFGATTTAGQAIASRMNVVKTCGTDVNEECFVKFDDYFDGTANSTIHWQDNVSARYKFTTADGVSFSVGSYGSNCKTNIGFDIQNSTTYYSTCGWLYVDVNGAKKPNYFGRDVFGFFIVSGKNPSIYPFGGFYASWSNSGTQDLGGSDYWNYSGYNRCGAGGKSSTGCAGRIMEKGWIMDY